MTFGILFVLASRHCFLPEFVRAVGIAELVTAVALLVAGPGPLERFVTWWLQRPPAFIRCWCAGALAFGLLLAYSGA